MGFVESPVWQNSKGHQQDMSRKSHRTRIAISLAVLLLVPSPVRSQATVDLRGEWRLALDQDDLGIQQAWYDRVLEDRILLPGSLQQRGFGDDPGVHSPWVGDVRQEAWDQPKYAPYRAADNFKMPFWLQPDKVYVGPAWYHRDVTIYASWAGRRVVLSLERCHWLTQLWVDGREIGRRDSLSTPNEYDVHDWMGPGRHRLTLRVDNRLQVAVGVYSHSVSDHTQ